MSSKTLILITFFLLSAFAVQSQTIPDVHTILAQHGLPPGLLPDAAGEYHIINGELEVEVIPPYVCLVQLPSAILSYSKTVSGKISFAKLENVEGILLLQEFGWVPVTGIELVEKTIKLQVELDSREETVVSLPAVEFRDVPSCTASRLARKDSFFLNLFQG